MKYIKEEGIWIWAECAECGMIMKFRKDNLRLDKSSRTYHLSEKVECFCGAESDLINNAIVNEQEPIIIEKKVEPVLPEKNIPRCPTCGSPNITKISLGSKAVGGAMFGIFSSNIRNSYKCNNCGYKW